MKKTLISILTIVIIASMFVCSACGSRGKITSREKYIGTWKVTAVSIQNGAEKKEKNETENADNNWTMLLNENGTGQFANKSGVNNIRWKITKTGIKTRGDIKLEFEYDKEENTLVTIVKDNKLIFEK